jgi:phenylacetate-CoA ligase
MTVETIYSRLPVVLQQAACSVKGWRIQRHRYGDGFAQLLHEAEMRALWPSERLLEYRDQRARRFRDRARSCVPYYRDRPEYAADASEPPVLEKTTVRENTLAFRAVSLRPGEFSTVHTSGTTGAGLRFWSTPMALQEQWAIWWRYRRWHGLEPGTPCGYFGGRTVVPLAQTAPPYWRYDLAGRQVLFSAYHFSDDCLPHYIAELRRRRPPWLHGYPSLLALLAAYVLDRGLDLGYNLRWITTGAENLLPQQRALLERAFGVRPRQHYGMAEAVGNASECEAGRLHVDEDFAAIEFLPEARPEDDRDEAYRVVGTNFTNPATPLIRYAVSDRVRLENSGCSCGRPGRILAQVDGRQEDYVISASGARVGRLDHIFKDLTNVREAQIVQDSREEVRIRVVRGQHFTATDEAALLREAAARLGATRVRLEYPEQLERSATGKLRFVINRLAEGQISSCFRDGGRQVAGT